MFEVQNGVMQNGVDPIFQNLNKHQKLVHADFV